MKNHALLLVALSSICIALLQGQQVFVNGPQLDTAEDRLWSIPFHTTPTHRYRLERSSDLISWQPLQTITADSTESRVTDRRTPHGRRFWRVVALGPSSGNPTITDTIPPTVSPLCATFGESNGTRTLTLETTVTDNLGVDAVNIFDGMQLLGTASSVGGNRWRFVYTYTNASELNGRAFVARAEDAAGNTAFSAPLSLAFNNTDRFQPINGGGDDEVALGVDGTLPAFAFNPSSDSAAGEGTGLSFGFPEGGMITSDPNGRAAVAFEAGTFEFEAQAPLKLKEPLSVTSNQTKTLPLEEITFEDIATAFEQDPEEGIEVELFGTFPLTWKGGALEGAAIRAPQFEVNIPNFPLPDVSAEAPDLLVNFSQDEPIQLPFSGTFELPGAGENAPSLHAPASSPLWVTLCPDGRVSLRGRVEVRIPGSLRFVADIVLEDAYYRLRIATLESEAEARERLANNLPADPSELITAGMSTAQLQEAADMLRNHADAYANFAANTIASAAAGSSGLDNLSPSGLLNQIGSPTAALLDAWSLVDGSHLEALGSYFDQVGRSAASSQSLEGTLESACALVRIQNGDLTGSSEALDAAVELAFLAITNRAQDTTADVGLESFLKISEALSELQTLGETDVLSIIQSSINALIQQIAVRESARLDLSALPSGTFVELARTLGTIHANLDAAGFDVSPLDPLLDDVFGQTMATLEDRLNEAELGNDLFGLVEVMLTWISLSEFSDTFTTPAATTINQLAGQFALPEDGIALNDLIKQASAWQEISDHLALNANVSSELAAALNSAIENALPEVADLQNPAMIVQLIRAGTTMQALAPTVSQAWFDAQLPAMIARLRDIADVNKQSSTLDAIFENLLDAADARPDFAEAYLTQAGDLLESTREVALDLWREEESRRATASDYPAADIQLPGDITIDDAYGEISFHRLTQELSGAFGGSIKLPNFGDSFLTVANASLNSGGAFDINAYGSMSFPFDSPVATVSIREDHPMHVR